MCFIGGAERAHIATSFLLLREEKRGASNMREELLPADANRHAAGWIGIG
jgi:hypothetical protein